MRAKKCKFGKHAPWDCLTHNCYKLEGQTLCQVAVLERAAAQLGRVSQSYKKQVDALGAVLTEEIGWLEGLRDGHLKAIVRRMPISKDDSMFDTPENRDTIVQGGEKARDVMNGLTNRIGDLKADILKTQRGGSVAETHAVMPTVDGAVQFPPSASPSTTKLAKAPKLHTPEDLDARIARMRGG